MKNDNELLIINELKSIDLENLTPTVIQSDDFNAKYGMLLDTLDKLTTLKKDVDSSMKKALQAQYMKTGEGKVKTDTYVYSYVPGSTRESIDTAKLKAEDPETYKKYVKVSTVSESIRINKVSNKQEKAE